MTRHHHNRHHDDTDIQRPLPRDEPPSPYLRDVRSVQNTIRSTVAQIQRKLKEIGERAPNDPEQLADITVSKNRQIAQGNAYGYHNATKINGLQSNLRALLQREQTLYKKHRQYIENHDDKDTPNSTDEQ